MAAINSAWPQQGTVKLLFNEQLNEDSNINAIEPNLITPRDERVQSMRSTFQGQYIIRAKLQKRCSGPRQLIFLAR